MEGGGREGVDSFDGFDSADVDGRDRGWRSRRRGLERSEGWFEVVDRRWRREVGSGVEVDDGGEEFGLVEESIDDRLPEVHLRRRRDSVASVIVPD